MEIEDKPGSTWYTPLLEVDEAVMLHEAWKKALPSLLTVLNLKQDAFLGKFFLIVHGDEHERTEAIRDLRSGYADVRKRVTPKHDEAFKDEPGKRPSAALDDLELVLMELEDAQAEPAGAPSQPPPAQPASVSGIPLAPLPRRAPKKKFHNPEEVWRMWYHLHHGKTIPEIAKGMFISESYLTRIFDKGGKKQERREIIFKPEDTKYPGIAVMKERARAAGIPWPTKTVGSKVLRAVPPAAE